MKLCAIFLCWSDWDWLDHSVKNIEPVVDGVIIIAPTKSNYGESCEIPERWYKPNTDKLALHLSPTTLHYPSHSETSHRNAGLFFAREAGYTHFIMLDADEMYDEDEFLREKKRFEDNPNLAGLVCRTQVYFKSPTLTIGYDTTLVPFIHKLTPNLKHEFNRSYPFAWEGKSIRIDPTRSLNINSGVEWSDITMHHFSHVRKDYAKKIRNSTAKANLERSTIVQDLLHAKENYFCQFYQKPLVRVPNRFGIPEYGELVDNDLQL